MEKPAEFSLPLTRLSPIKHLIPHFQTAPIVVPKDTPITALPSLVAGNHDCRTIAVVDEGGVLVGIIPVAVVLQDLLLWMMPEEFLGDVLEPDRAAELARERHARTAGELMHPPLALSAEAPVRDCLHRLHQADLEGLPIVDEAHRVIAYFNLLEFTLFWWQQLHSP